MAGKARAAQFTPEYQAAAGHASVTSSLVRWQASEGLPPQLPDDARRYLTPDSIRGLHGASLPPALRDEVYRAWCAGHLYPVAAWISDDPPHDPNGLWAALPPPLPAALQAIQAVQDAQAAQTTIDE